MINPMPFHDFVDVIVVGEGRDALYETVTRYRCACAAGQTKRDALLELGISLGSIFPATIELRFTTPDTLPLSCAAMEIYIESNVPLDLTEYPMYSNWTSRFACYEQEDYFSIMAAMGCHKKVPVLCIRSCAGSEVRSCDDYRSGADHRTCAGSTRSFWNKPHEDFGFWRIRQERGI